MVSDKIVYCLNGAAVGDLVAAAPSVKWAIDKFHKEKDYRVAMFPEFRDIFPFVPDDKIIPIQAKYDGDFAVRKLNMDGGGGNVARLTPSRMKLTHYAAVGLLSRIPSDDELKYVPLTEVDVSHFNVDFSKAVVFITTYRDITRAIKGEEIVKMAKHVHDKGFTPVFVGKKGAISIWKTLAVTDFEYPGFGVDLLDKTTIPELATIMKKSKCVIGMDSGPLHIAFTTDTHVVAGFTNVEPSLRIPKRNDGAKTISVTPNLICKFCQSNWNLDFWNFTKCPRGQSEPDCTKQMKAEIFIKGFDLLGLTP
jgi:hypothetical protein